MRQINWVMAVLVLGGCSTSHQANRPEPATTDQRITSHRSNLLKLGMTAQQVYAALGKPDLEGHGLVESLADSPFLTDEHKTWAERADRLHYLHAISNSGDKIFFVVVLFDGRVTHFGVQDHEFMRHVPHTGNDVGP